MTHPDERLEALIPALVTMHTCEPEAQTLIADEIQRLREAIADALVDLEPGVAPYSLLHDALAVSLEGA